MAIEGNHTGFQPNSKTKASVTQGWIRRLVMRIDDLPYTTIFIAKR